MRTAIIGGGAAGFFLAVSLKEMLPSMGVTVFERTGKVLSKVRISGGGRCNCTNSFDNVSDVSQVYPRGHRLMKRLFNVFDYRDAYRWFEAHGVPLVTQSDGCVFPAVQDSQAVIDSFLGHAARLGVAVSCNTRIESLASLSDFDFVAVATGGSPSGKGLQWLADCGHQLEPPVPSLFSFSIADERLRSLQGLVAPAADVSLPGTKLRASGPLLITHWGLSGPAILRLSSYAARHLAGAGYASPICISWTGRAEDEVRESLVSLAAANGGKMLSTVSPLGLSSRLWEYLLEKSVGSRMQLRWSDVGKKDFNRIVNAVAADVCQIVGRAPFKDEFVTCGGVSLKSVNLATLESRSVPNLFFAGEVLDVDGVTGGFNFQAAWTTAYTVAQSISQKAAALSAV